MKVRLTLTEELLATKASDPDIFKTWQLSKAPDAERSRQEMEVSLKTADELSAEANAELERGTSVFHRVDGVPVFWDYQIKGFFKDACGALRNADGTRSKDLKAYKTRIDGLVFVFPRLIPIGFPAGKELGVSVRPLVSDTAQGRRTSLIRSEAAPIGSTLDIEIKTLKADLEPTIMEWLAYGELRGLGQWRNSGKGRFTVAIIE